MSDCKHKWDSLAPSIAGLGCKDCQRIWPWGSADIALWMSATQKFEAQQNKITALHHAVSKHLKLQACDVCGEYFSISGVENNWQAGKWSKDGLFIDHYALCSAHVLQFWYTTMNDMHEADYERTCDRLARWFWHYHRIPEVREQFKRLGLEEVVRSLSPRIRRLFETEGRSSVTLEQV